jgi:predicted GNAT family acetyltransferase
VVAIPVEGLWSIRPLGDEDNDRALAFLGAEPLLNVFLISKILDYGIGGAVPFLEVTHNGRIVCLASVGSNIVLAVAPDADADLRNCALEMLAQRILERYLPVRAIISDTALVERLWKRLRLQIDPPTVLRLNQPVYALEAAAAPDTGLQRMRFSTLADLDPLVPACAAMHREEVGIDPLARDAYGYRQRVRELVVKRRSLIHEEKREIVFKCELSAVTERAVQLMGVWTSPRFRRQGHAARDLQEICGHIAAEGKATTLFVNDFNTPAIRLYESLGFVRIGQNRALIW